MFNWHEPCFKSSLLALFLEVKDKQKEMVVMDEILKEVMEERKVINYRNFDHNNAYYVCDVFTQGFLILYCGIFLKDM